MEQVATLFTLLSVYLTTKNNNLCWPIGIIGIFGFMNIFYQNNDLANFGLQFLFLFQSIRGWLNWNNKEINIKNWSQNEKITTFIVFSSILITLFLIFKYFFDDIKYLDIFTTSLSITALFLLTRKIIQTWYFWMIANVLYIIMFFEQQLYYSTILYFILLLLAFNGLLKWKKQL